MRSSAKVTKKSKSKSLLIVLTLPAYSEDWDILWVDREVVYDLLNHTHLQQHQRVNHYRNHFELTRKDLMIKNLKRQKKQNEKEGKFDDA